MTSLDLLEAQLADQARTRVIAELKEAVDHQRATIRRLASEVRDLRAA